MRVDWRRRRIYIRRRRLHHGLTGVLLVLSGAALVWHDWGDRPWRFCVEN